MWRKQEQIKPSSAAAEAAGNPAVDTPASIPEAPAQARQVVLPGSRLTGALTIKGVIQGNEDLLIDARLEGLVHLVGATAVVGENGRVAANITATDITVEGDLSGDLQAADRVRISSTGKTRGSIDCRRLSVEDGAEIRGDVEVRRDVDVPVPIIPTSADVAVPHSTQAVAALATKTSAA